MLFVCIQLYAIIDRHWGAYSCVAGIRVNGMTMERSAVDSDSTDKPIPRICTSPNECSYLFSTNYKRPAKMIDWMVGVRASHNAIEKGKTFIFQRKSTGFSMIWLIHKEFFFLIFTCVLPLDLFQFYSILLSQYPPKIGFPLRIIFMNFDIEARSLPSYFEAVNATVTRISLILFSSTTNATETTLGAAMI